MNIHDFSLNPQRRQQLEEYKSSCENDDRKGEHIDLFSADLIIKVFEEYKLETDSDPPDALTNADFLPPAYPPCVVPVDQLTKMMIRDLRLKTHHRGRYLLLRTVTEMYVKSNTKVVVEDEEENALMLELHNQGYTSSTERPPLGTVLLIKEPYQRCIGDICEGIRVDHLTDIKIISPYDTSTFKFVFGDSLSQGTERDLAFLSSMTSASWKETGNSFFKKQKYGPAIDCYTKGLESGPSQDLAKILRLNRAMAYLKDHRFDAALLDAEAVLQEDEVSEKGLYRKAQSLGHLGRFRECCETYIKLTEKYPNNELAQKCLEEARRWRAQEDYGEYEFKEIDREVASLPGPLLINFGSYIGPVSVRPTQNHGRGLFTTKAVKAGDLLLCEKAFAYADDQRRYSKNIGFLFNADMDKVTFGTQKLLVETIVQKLHKNPSLLPLILDLGHGDYESVEVREVDGTPIIDSFLVERIIHLNCIGCPLYSFLVHSKIASEATEIEQTGDPAEDAVRNEEWFSGFSTGLWLTASSINHSCFRNAIPSFIGNMMIVRATRDLPPDTEITFWYNIPGPEKTQTPLELKHWGFSCDCLICHDRQTCSKRKFSTRARILQDIREWQTEWNPDYREEARQLDRALSRMATTYSKPPSEIPRLEMAHYYFRLASDVLVMGHERDNITPQDVEGVVKAAMKSLESLGFVIEGGILPHEAGQSLKIVKWGVVRHDVVSCWVMLSTVYRKVAPEIADQAETYAKLAYKMCVGEDETYKIIHARGTVVET